MDENRVMGGAMRLSLERLPTGKRRHALLSTLALELGTSFGEMARLTETLPTSVEVHLAPQGLEKLESTLQHAGVSFDLNPAEPSHAHCAAHTKLGGDRRCSRCGASGCVLCVRSVGRQQLCPSCAGRERRRHRFFILRVSLWSAILVVVLLWALGDWRSRKARNDWRRPVNVAVVLVARDEVDQQTIALLRERLSKLQDVLGREATRYGVPIRPFQFVFYGPARAGASPPPPSEEGLWPLAKHTYRQHRYLGKIDGMLGIDTSAWDSRIYLVARRPLDERVQFVEGYGQAGGRIGIVEVELTTGMVDAVLAVAAHELFHTLGARDKYAPRGDTVIPDGLVQPNKVPLLPQSHVEVMARGRPLDARGSEAQLERVEELGVGPSTAKEIGWLPTGD